MLPPPKEIPVVTMYPGYYYADGQTLAVEGDQVSGTVDGKQVTGKVTQVRRGLDGGVKVLDIEYKLTDGRETVGHGYARDFSIAPAFDPHDGPQSGPTGPLATPAPVEAKP